MLFNLIFFKFCFIIINHIIITQHFVDVKINVIWNFKKKLWWYAHFLLFNYLINNLFLFIFSFGSLSFILLDVTDAMPVLLVLVMDQVQVLRRSYETFFVNIFSATATMTLLHYILGIVFYLSFGLCVLTGTDFEQLQIKGVDIWNTELLSIHL